MAPITLDAALYGPEGSQPINSDNFLTIEQLPGHTATVEFSIPAWNEFAVDGYQESALTGGSVDKLFRARQLRSQPGRMVVHPHGTHALDRHRLVQARTAQRAQALAPGPNGNIRALKQVIAFGDDPGSGYGAAFVTVTLVGPM